MIFKSSTYKGADNTGADALSRIDFDEIRGLTTINEHIFKVTTRSDSRRVVTPVPKHDNGVALPPDESKILEVIHVKETKHMVRLVFII